MRDKSLMTESRVVDGCRTGTTEGVSQAEGVARRLWTRVRGWFEIPYGYEDDTGFHYGKPSRPQYPLALTDRACNAMGDSSPGSPLEVAVLSSQPTPNKLGTALPSRR